MLVIEPVPNEVRIISVRGAARIEKRDYEVAKVFKNGESVNAVLRSIMKALPADGTTV